MINTFLILTKKIPTSNIFTQFRNIASSQPHFLKQVIENKEGKKLVIDAEYVKPDWEPYYIKSAIEDPKACPVCSTNLDIKHTDVKILAQFLRKDGCMLPRRVTGLCKTQQKRISYMVSMAQNAGLLLEITPEKCKKDQTRRRDWKKFKSYYDESTIRLPAEYRKKKEQIFKYV